MLRRGVRVGSSSLHWKNKGVFQTELRGKEENEGDEEGKGDEGDDEDRILVPGPSGLFQHWNQVEQHRLEPEPDALCIGNMVLVDSQRDVGGTDHKPEAKFGFRMGKIFGVNRLLQRATVQWWCTSGTQFKVTGVWRPWLTQRFSR